MSIVKTEGEDLSVMVNANVHQQTPLKKQKKSRKGEYTFKTDKSCGVLVSMLLHRKTSKEAFMILQINRPKSMRHPSQAFSSHFLDTSVKRAMPNNDG